MKNFVNQLLNLKLNLLIRLQSPSKFKNILTFQEKSHQISFPFPSLDSNSISITQNLQNSPHKSSYRHGNVKKAKLHSKNRNLKLHVSAKRPSKEENTIRR
jgi:hypothetical protein